MDNPIALYQEEFGVTKHFISLSTFLTNINKCLSKYSSSVVTSAHLPESKSMASENATTVASQELTKTL